MSSPLDVLREAIARMSRLPPIYDPACEDLARHFLGRTMGDDLTTDLAQHIQDAVEVWFGGLNDEDRAAANAAYEGRFT